MLLSLHIGNGIIGPTLCDLWDEISYSAEELIMQPAQVSVVELLATLRCRCSSQVRVKRPEQLIGENF